MWICRVSLASVILVEHIPGHNRRLIGAGALGIDGYMDQIGIAFLPGFLKQLGIKRCGHLGRGGKLRGGIDDFIELGGLNIHAVPVLLVPSQDGQGQHRNIQFFAKGLRDIRRGVRCNSDFGHNQFFLSVFPDFA